MKIVFKSFCFLFLGFSLIANASEFSTDYRAVEKIRFYPADRPQHVSYQDIAIVHLSSGTISGDAGGCDTTRFAVLNSDESLISALLSARIAGLDVSLAIEKSFTHGNGVFCRIVKVEV